MTGYEKSLVREALQAYPCGRVDLHFLRHNENITCRVTTRQGEVYVLRIQAPVPGFSLGLYEEIPLADRMQGEAELLLHLSQTAPFPVQTPVKNHQGEYVTILSQGIPCEMLRWVHGEPLSQVVERGSAHKDRGEYAKELGILAARLHEAAEGFSGTRLAYSHKLVERMGAELLKACEQTHISRDHWSVCRDVLEEVDHIMTELDQCPEAASLIHADLSFDNVLQTSSGLAPIDFSLSGFGYRAQECGMLAANYEDKDLQEQIRKSYEKTGKIAIKQHHMEAFLAFSILLFVTAQHNRFWREKWFQDSMQRWAGGLFDQVLRQSLAWERNI